jgi:hypothetical protein
MNPSMEVPCGGQKRWLQPSYGDWYQECLAVQLLQVLVASRTSSIFTVYQYTE